MLNNGRYKTAAHYLKQMNRVFIILSALVLASCTETIDIQLEPEVNAYLSSDSTKTIRLGSTDKEYADLNQWLHDHSSGWYSTSGRYPGGVYIKSGSHGIQVTETHVILYSTTPPEPKAIYIQKVANGDLSGILSLGK